MPIDSRPAIRAVVHRGHMNRAVRHVILYQGRRKCSRAWVGNSVVLLALALALGALPASLHAQVASFDQELLRQQERDR